MQKRALPLLLVSLAGCLTDLQVPDDAEIACNDAADCPDGLKCIVEVGRCAPATSADTTAPGLTGVVLTPSAGGGTAVFTLTFTADEPLLVQPVVTGEITGLSLHWSRLEAADGYAFSYAASTATPDGAMTVKVRLIDLAGNAVTATAGTVTVDTAGPAINLLLVNVTSNVPGVADTVAGAAHATEGGVHIDCFADEGATTPVGAATAGSDGSFAAVSLGDNYTLGTLHGQSAFWLRATDSFGNVGDAVPVVTIVTPPAIQLVGVERLTENDSWVAATAFRDTNGDPSGRVRVLVAGQLAALPQLTIGVAGPGTVFETACGLESLGPAGGVYVCFFGADGSEPEATPLDVVIDAVSFGAGNVGALSAGSVLLDFTPPATPNAASISVTMNPTGTPDSLTLASGTVEPNARVEVYSVLTFNTPFGFQCENQVIASGQADASGGAVLDLGDNLVGTARLHQIDAAGNPGCGPCSIPFPCSNYAPVLNDVAPPAISINTSVRPIPSATEAAFYVAAVERGPLGESGPIVHPPVETYCALDGGPETSCGLVFTANALAAGAHRVSYRARDGLLNSTSPQTFAWQVLPTAAIFTGNAYGSLGDKSYVVDGAGLGHLFLGGEALYHVYESSPGVFAVEAIGNDPASYAVADVNPSNNELHVAFQRGGTEAFDVVLAKGTTGAWSLQTLYSGRVPTGSVDLARDGTGALHVAYSRCTAVPDIGCFVNGGSLNAFAIDIATVSSGAPVFETVPVTAHSLQPRLAVGSPGELWLFYRDDTGSGVPTLELAKRASGVWQAPLVVGGAGAPGGAPAVGAGNSQFFPTIAVTSIGAPALTYKPSLAGNVWSAVYDSGTWTFHDTGLSAQTASLSTATVNLWYAVAQGPVDIVRRSPAPAWTTTSLGSGVSPWFVAGSLLTDGTYGSTAQLQVVSAFVDQNTTLKRTFVNGGSTTSVQVGSLDGYRSFAPLRGAANPSAVVAAGSTMTVRQFSAGTWNTTATIRSNLGSEGFGLAAVSGGATTWAAHLDHVSASTSALLVEQGSGVSWTARGPYLSGEDLMAPQVAILPSGNPVVVLVDRSVPALLATWWDGAQFVNFTTLVSLSNPFQVSSYAVLGDHNGALSGGETWVAYGDTVNQQARVVRFTVTSENPNVAGCESPCVVENAGGASQPWVTIGLSPAGSQQVMMSDPSAGISLLTRGASTWQTRDLYSELESRVLDPDSGTWMASAPNCFPLMGAPRSPFTFTYDGSGHLRINGRFACFVWGDDNVEIMALEGASDFGAYPVGSTNVDPADLVHGIWSLPSGATLGAWGNPSAGDVLSFDSSNL